MMISGLLVSMYQVIVGGLLTPVPACTGSPWSTIAPPTGTDTRRAAVADHAATHAVS